jgi:transcriptional antiterminator RfaH
MTVMLPGPAVLRGSRVPPVPLHLDRRWFAVNTQPSSETRACVNLERQGWQTFCPRTYRTIRSGRRVKTELRPFFPGYVFVSLDLRVDGWRSVGSTFGVRAIVRNGDQPTAVPEGIVEGLMAMTQEDGRIVFTADMQPGDKVKFLSGPFAEMIGSLERLDANGRVMVLLDLLGRVTQVQARAADLLPVR